MSIIQYFNSVYYKFIRLFVIVAIECSEEDKLSLYRNILEQLKPINYVTVRKLIGHLYAIHLQRQKNLMSVENLAAIWGPTLMHVEVNNNTFTFFPLFFFYSRLF